MALYEKQLEKYTQANSEIVYLDESGMDKGDNSPKYGYSKKGTRVFATRSTKDWTRINTVAALNKDGKFIAPIIYSASTTRILFEHYLKTYLLPKLKKNSVLVMDNASFHKGGNVKTLCDSFDVKILYLPPYSPEKNSIEHYWARLKARTRSICVEKMLSIEEGMCHAYDSLILS